MLKDIRKRIRDARKLGIFLDLQGVEMKVGDHIMFITGSGSSTYFNYGFVETITCNHDTSNPWSIRVFKEASTGWLDKPKTVILHDPMVFICGTRLEYQHA